MSDKENLDTMNLDSTISGAGQPKDDTDLTGMDLPQAQEYILSFMTTLKETQRQIAELKKEEDLWKPRVELAQKQVKPDLEQAAQKKLDEVSRKIAAIAAEEEELSGKCSVMLENLKKLKATGVSRSIDTDRLLADFEMIVGNKDDFTLKEAMKHEEANAELEKLKAKMQAEKKE